MLAAVRLLLLVNWEERGQWYFYRRIRERFGAIRLLQPQLYRLIPDERWQRCSIWLSEFLLPVRALLIRTSCDVVVSWSMRMGVWYGILNRLFRSRTAPAHVMYDFHINPNRTDIAYRLRHALLRLAVPGIDYFLCTSRQEADLYAAQFGIARNRISFFPMTPPPHYCEAKAGPRGDYILAYGNSDRDYDTLVRAAADLPVRVVILSQRYRPQAALPANITLITQKTVGQDLISLIAGARCVVLPLKDGAVSAGQTAMLETMALARPLVVTDNPATREYAVHGDSALLYPAGNADALRAHLQTMLEDPGRAEQIGSRARDISRTYPDRQVEEFCRVVAGMLS